MRPSLLLVDDDVPSREMLGACLAKQGFDVAGAADAGEARQRLEAGHFDLVLLDINLPGTDGLTLAREFRLESEIGIIMLTSREGQMDRVLGLEWGADDYVTKDTPLAELIARIRALLRRTGRGAQHDEVPLLAVVAEAHVERVGVLWKGNVTRVACVLLRCVCTYTRLCLCVWKERERERERERDSLEKAAALSKTTARDPPCPSRGGR